MKNQILYSLTLIIALFLSQETHAQQASSIKSTNAIVPDWSRFSKNFPGSINAFEENNGQYPNLFNNEKVLYGCLYDGQTILFTEKGIIYSMKETVRKKRMETKDEDFKNQEEEKEKEGKNISIVLHHLQIGWKNANLHPRIETIEETPFYFGADGADHIKGYQKLIYHDVYPGIDVEFELHAEKGIKYTLHVKPGVDPSVFVMQYDGHKGLSIDNSGDLHIKTFMGDFIDHAPVSFQNGKKVVSSFRKLNSNEVGFKLGRIDPALDLIIDPWLVSPTTGSFAPVNVGVDAANNAYVFGAYSASTWDIRQFVQKYSNTGALLWTYTITEWVGGNGDYWVADFVVNPAGDIYIAAYYQNRKCGGSQWGMINLNSAGVRNYNYCGNGANSGFISETWNLAYSCNYSTLIQGGCYNKPLNTAQVALANPATGALGASSYNILVGEIYAGTVAPNGYYYALAADSNATWTTSSYTASQGPNNYVGCYQVTGGTVTELWWKKTNYSYRDFSAKMPLSLGTNGIGAGCKYLYTSDGIKLDQRDLTTGALIKRINIPAGSTTQPNVNSGIAVDLLCGYVYAGSKGFVYIYDENLNSVGSYNIGANNIAFDVKYNNGIISVSGATNSTTSAVGQGFVAQFTALTCVNTLNIAHTDANICGTPGTATANPTFCAPPYTYLWTPGGQTTQTATGLVAGTYTVQVGTVSGCATVTDTVTIFQQGTCGINVTTTPATICNGACGTISATGTSGTAPYTYAWSPATGLSTTTGASISACPAVTTTYTVIATDNAGKTATATATVTVNPKPAITLSSASVCPGSCATITAGGGISYSWSAPFSGTASTQNACPAATSSYSVTGTDANGCTNTATATVTIHPLPTVTVSNLTVCKDTAGTITASGASTYTWSCGGTGAIISANTSVIGVSTCTVTGTDANGCINTSVSTITINDCSTPNVTVPDATICIGTCHNITATGTGGVGALTYTWNPNLGAGAGPFSVCPTSTSSYTVTVTDANGATASDIAVVTVNPLPTITATSTNVCNGVCATITANGAGTGTYTWSSPLGSGASQNVCPATTTSYSLTGTDANGCTNTATTTVTVNPIPVITIADASICPGGSTTLTASGADTYTWSPATNLSAATGATVTANPGTTTTYTVCGTSTDGCSSCTTVKVTVGALVATVSPNATICFGACTNITAGGGTIYSWTPATGLSDPNIFNPVACPTVTTTYTVVVSDGNCSDDAVVVVTVNPAISLNVAPVNVTCFGACNGQTIVIPSGGTSPYTYAWSGGCTLAACSNVCAGIYTLTATDAMGCTATGSAVVTEPTALTIASAKTDVSCFGVCDGTASVTVGGATSPYSYAWTPNGGAAATATGLCAGSYTCTVTDANNCTINTSVVITQPTAIVVSSAGGSICPGGSIPLNTSATGGSGGFAFSWTPATGLSDPAIFNPVASPTATTVYTITATDANNCTGSTSITVTVNSAPIVSVPAAAICEGTTTTLTASGANTYSWTPAAGLSNPAIASPVAGPSATTTYTVIGTSAFGCTGSVEVIVTVNPRPVLVPVGGNACPGDSIPLAVSGASSYSWSPSAGLSANTGAAVIATPPVTTVFTIVGTGTNGCTSATTVTATVNPKPNASFTTSPDVVDEFDPTLYFTDLSTGGTISSWVWNFGDSANTGSAIQNPTFTYPPVSNTYLVQLIVTNQYGCIDTTTGTVYVRGIFTFYIPNTFTPNDDGVNDRFMPRGTGIDESDYHLWIFDRWGNLIWQTEIWGEAWDGRANGGTDIAQIDTYVWKVHVKEKDSGAKHNYIGHVNIVK